MEVEAAAEERGAVPKWVVDSDNVIFDERLAAGAYGKVHRGRYRRDHVAIKVLHSSRLTARGRKYFFREIQALSDLRHNYIVKFLGACLHKNRTCILFEQCAVSLFNVLHTQTDPIEPQRMILTLKQVALALNYLHGLDPPQLHLDLKSENVLLDASGTAKVCAFGMGHVKRGMGSVRWTAPEKLRCHPCDEKADSYSYGALLYEVMARKLPYAGQCEEHIYCSVITGTINRLQLTEEEARPWPSSLGAPGSKASGSNGGDGGDGGDGEGDEERDVARLVGEVEGADGGWHEEERGANLCGRTVL